MKRSETILVYGVTGILAVILGIAVIFGNDPVKSTSSVANASGPLDLEGLLDPSQVESLPVEDADPATDSALESATEGEAANALQQAAEPPVAVEVLPPALEVPLTIKPEPTVASLLGANRIVEVEGDIRYRVVKVAKGDAMSVLVQRWCGSLDEYWDEAVALNEQIDVQRLAIGAEIWLPYLDDQTLMDAYAMRGMNATVPATASSNSGAPVEGQSGGASLPSGVPPSGSEYVLKAGESLWVVAVRQVSPRRAKAYIEEILKLNSKITDPGRVRSGMKIMLPPTEKQ